MFVLAIRAIVFDGEKPVRQGDFCSIQIGDLVSAMGTAAVIFFRRSFNEEWGMAVCTVPWIGSICCLCQLATGSTDKDILGMPCVFGYQVAREKSDWAASGTARCGC